ncbi:MAG: WG repeat-containing protein [Cyclobacteriaceae bacterium]
MRLVISLLIFGSHISQAQADAFQLFEENGKVGLRNQQGAVVIPATYEALGWSDNTFSVLGNTTGYKLNGQWGLVNLSNQRLTKAEFFQLYPGDSRRLIAVRQSPTTFRISAGCLAADGRVIIPFNYTGIKLHGLRAITYTLSKDNSIKYGLVDLDNKTILPALYQNIYPLGSLRYAVQNIENKTALFTENGKAITGFVIDSIGPFTNNLAILYQGARQGLIDRDGVIVKEPVFREIKVENNSFTGRYSDEFHILSSTNAVIRKIEADSIASLATDRFKLVTAKGTQLLRSDFEPVSSTYFKLIQPFQHNLTVFSLEGSCGVMRRNGSVLIHALHRQIKIKNGFLVIEENTGSSRRWSLYDTLGNRLTKKYYQYLDAFGGSYFRATENGFQGLVRNDGTEQVACVYDSLLEYKDGLLVVQFRGQYGILSEKEGWIVVPQPERIRLIDKDHFLTYTEHLTMLKTTAGSVLYFTTNPVELQENVLIERVSSGGKWTINFSGQIIRRELPPAEKTELIWPATEGFRMIKRNGRYGFIDDQARLLIPNRYEEARPFKEGLAPIKIRNKWGFINREDKIAVQPIYEQVTAFDQGYSVVMQNGKSGLIDVHGKLLLPVRYDELIIQPNRRILVKSDGLLGIADSNGGILLFPKYESVTDLDNGYFVVQQNKKWGLVDQRGVTTIPLVYDSIFYHRATDNYIAQLKKPWEQVH